MVVAAAQTAFLLDLSRDLWFVWGDDYDFFLLRGTIPGVSVGWWAPHDDHWMTAIVVIDRLLFSVVGLHSYVPYVAVTISLHLGIVYLLHRLLRHLGAGPWVAAITCVVALCAGVGGGAILWNTAAGLVGSIFFALVAVHLGLRHGYDGRGMLMGWVALTIGLTFSGTGIVGVFVATVFAWMRLGWRIALQVMSVPTVVFVTWYVNIGRTGAKAPLDDRWDYLHIPELIWTGLTFAPGTALGMPALGPVILISLVGVTLAAPARVPRGLRHLALAGIAGAMAQVTLAAVSRPSFGVDAFASGRYAYLTMMLLAPAVALAMTAAVPLVTAPKLLVVLLAGWLLVLYVAQGQQLFRGEQTARIYVSEPWPGIMRGLRDAAKDGEGVLTISPPETDTVHLRFRADLAARPEMWDAMPTGAATPEERLDAERMFFVGLGTESFGLGTSSRPEPDSGFAGDHALTTGCATWTATTDSSVISLRTGSQGSELGMLGPATSITTTLVRDDVESSARTWPVEPQRGYWVATTARDAVLRVELATAGDYTICRL